ncbi:gamma-glutamylcyclotransferase [Paracoccus xiamenensis]|uniref:gamma-glutamylcyclotransferase n=1 Tax=Paracoccus xiamenensis TaxID=2714901 RepID=UPI0014094281|nr:gamma-glutamylcyclotransferase [Paracoccus xiamenensis]NHF72558.1 gamma-glutamylcyclotransferase [Paracoccus xiamenensis]
MSDPADQPRLRLTDALVQRATQVVDGPLYRDEWHLLDDAELDRLADDLTRGRPTPVPIFAYGSLIWNSGFAVSARRRATAIGWHRQFSIALDHFRGSVENPGLMLALASGGTCEGLVLDVAPGTEHDSLRAVLKRELVAHELAANARWIEVEIDGQRSEALTFYADPIDVPLTKLPVADQARLLARANGAAGSGSEYLLRTAQGLEAAGIRDPYIWELQELVAAEIESWPAKQP